MRALRSPTHDGDRGAVTVEAAIALSGFIVVLALALAAIAALTDQLRCVDAAREAARLVARGEPELAVAAARQIAPRNATVSVATGGDTVEVHVLASPVMGLLPGVHLRGDAYAVAEPGGAP